jgi:hypothetical protein
LVQRLAHVIDGFAGIAWVFLRFTSPELEDVHEHLREMNDEELMALVENVLEQVPGDEHEPEP